MRTHRGGAAVPLILVEEAVARPPAVPPPRAAQGERSGPAHRRRAERTRPGPRV